MIRDVGGKSLFVQPSVEVSMSLRDSCLDSFGSAFLIQACVQDIHVSESVQVVPPL
jgi:hypothetical protein